MGTRKKRIRYSWRSAPHGKMNPLFHGVVCSADVSRISFVDKSSFVLRTAQKILSKSSQKHRLGRSNILPTFPLSLPGEAFPAFLARRSVRVGRQQLQRLLQLVHPSHLGAVAFAGGEDADVLGVVGLLAPEERFHLVNVSFSF